MAERAYVEGKIFTRNAEGGDHLDHVFRLKTQRELSGDISVHGGDLSVILEQPAPLRRRKEGNYYYEVVGYAEGAEMEKIRLWLEKETGHRCVAVTHRDESKPHTHFLIPWTGQDRRALRLSKGSFWKINQFVAGAVGRQLTPRGQGRQKLPPGLIMGNPEEAARIIEGDKQRIARQLDGIGAMIDLYGPIELAAIGDKGRLVLKTVDNVDQVSLKQLMKFARRGDGIYFRPAERETHRVLFLDDVPEKALPNVPGTLVETSPGKYQVHVSLDSPVNTEQARAIQRYLCNFYEADRGCGPDVYHFRRVPGFTNQKYTDKPPVEIQERAEALRDKPYSTEHLLTQLQRARGDLAGRNVLSRIPRDDLSGAPKRWNDFASVDDLSVADMRYTVYLVARGAGLEEVRGRLLGESEDIMLRKGRAVDQYIERTYKKAGEWILGGEHTVKPSRPEFDRER